MDRFWLRIDGAGKGSIVHDLRADAPARFEITGERWCEISQETVLAMRGYGPEARKKFTKERLEAAFAEARNSVQRAYDYAKSRAESNEGWQVSRYDPLTKKPSPLTRIADAAKAAVGLEPSAPAPSSGSPLAAPTDTGPPAPSEPATAREAPPKGSQPPAGERVEAKVGGGARVSKSK